METGNAPSATRAFGHAWSLARRDFAGVILPIALGFLIVGVVNIAMGAALLPVKAGIAMKAGVGRAILVGALMDSAVAIPAMALSAFFGAGFYLFAAAVVRGQKPPLGAVFSGGPVFGIALVATLGSIGVPSILLPLLRLAPFGGLTVGLLLVFAGGMVWPWALATTIDRRLGGVDAITAGWAEAFKAPGTSILLMLMGGSGIFLCCLGVFVTMPLMYVAIAYVYHVRKGDISLVA